MSPILGCCCLLDVLCLRLPRGVLSLILRDLPKQLHQRSRSIDLPQSLPLSQPLNSLNSLPANVLGVYGLDCRTTLGHRMCKVTKSMPAQTLSHLFSHLHPPTSPQITKLTARKLLLLSLDGLSSWSSPHRSEVAAITMSAHLRW